MKKSEVFYKGGFYHVVLRGTQGQAVFTDRDDHLRFLEFLGRDLDKYAVMLYAYCLMPNHVHLLLEQGGDLPVPRLLRRLAAAYTHYFNSAHHKSGNLFQRPHQVVWAEKDKYILDLVRYVHLHPVRSKIVKKPGQYRWTSYLQYVRSGVRSPVKATVEPVLRAFGEDLREARESFGNFVKNGLKAGHQDELYHLKNGPILGNPTRPGVPQKRLEAPNPRLRLDLGEIWRVLLEREGLDREPGGRKRSDLVSEAAYLAVRFGGIQQKDVGEYFDLSQSAVSRAMGRLEEQWLTQPTDKDKWMEWLKRLVS